MEPPRDESQDDGEWPEAVNVVGDAATPTRTRRAAVVGVLAGLAGAVVAASSSELLSRLRGEVPAISIRASLGVVMAVLLATVLLAFIGLAYLTWVERPPRRRGAEPEVLEEEKPRRLMDWWALLLLPLLFASLISLGLALGWWFGQPGTSESPASSSPPVVAPPPGAPSGGDAGGWPVHWLVFAVLSSVGGAVAAVLLVRDWRRRHGAAKLAEAEELAVAVEESLADVEGEPDPRLAVIRAYGRMERALARAGAGRRPPETPLEYLARALAAVRVSHASITRLTSLFQRAEFSRHAIDGAMKREAIDALRDLRAELGRSGVAGATR